jgi:hypothetical protein
MRTPKKDELATQKQPMMDKGGVPIRCAGYLGYPF